VRLPNRYTSVAASLGLFGRAAELNTSTDLCEADNLRFIVVLQSESAGLCCGVAYPQPGLFT